MSNKKDKNKTNQQPIKKNKHEYKYQAINPQKQRVVSYIDGTSKEEVETFLKNEGLKKIVITKQNSILNMNIGPNKLKYSSLTFILTQLSTYLRAGIPLIDGIRILEKQAHNRFEKKLFNNLIFEIVKGESLSSAMQSQGNIFPKLLINMVKTAEATGDLPNVLDTMINYYDSIDKARKEVLNAMTYPIIIFIFSLIVIIFLFTYIVPEFIDLFDTNNATLPDLTKGVISISNFFQNNILVIIGIIIALIFIISISYKKSRGFRRCIQSFSMRIPFIGKLIIYQEVALFTKTFSSLLDHSVNITDTFEMLGDITNNVIFEDITENALVYLSKGSKISEAFENNKFFPQVAYEMIVTGENTGKLALMMNYVSKYYEDLHSNYVKRVNTFIEPILIILLSIIVGIVVLSIVIPMFSFYGQVA